MIDAYVRWAHLKEDGTPVIDAAGVIVALEQRSGGAWNALVLKYDGTFIQANPADLVVTKMPENRLDFETFKLGEPPVLNFEQVDEARLTDDAESTLALENFETYLDGKFPGLESYGGGPIERARAMLDSVANLIDCIGVEFPGYERHVALGEQPGDHAARLIRDLKAELLNVSGNAEKTKATIEKLEKELSAARKKNRPKGPPGPEVVPVANDRAGETEPKS